MTWSPFHRAWKSNMASILTPSFPLKRYLSFRDIETLFSISIFLSHVSSHPLSGADFEEMANIFANICFQPVFNLSHMAKKVKKCSSTFMRAVFPNTYDQY